MPASALSSARIARKIRETADSRFQHRLHLVFLVSEGWTCEDAGRAYGDSPRSVRRWCQAYEKYGDAGLQEKASGGRPARLTEDHLDAIRIVIKKPAHMAGVQSDTWTGKALADWLQREWSISITDRRARQILASFRPK